MTDGYSEVYGDIGGQRKQIAEGRSQLGKPVLGGSAKQRRVAMRRVKRMPEYREHMAAKREQHAALGSAEVELGEHESKVKEYEKEGYKVAKTPEGELQFTKTTMRKRVVKPPGARITWVERGGTRHVVGVKGSKVAGFYKRLAREFPGSQIISVVTYKGKTLWKADTTTKYQATPELKFLLTHSDIKEKQALWKAIGQGPATVPEGFIGPVQQPIYPAITKAYESLTPIEKTLYAKQFEVKTVTMLPEEKQAKPLSWAKKEMQKVQQAYKIHPLLGGTAELGFGITSSFASLAKPVAQYFAPELKQVHYPSTLDVVFEPIGWSPKGSTEFIRQHPIFGVGGVVGEAAQVITFHGVGKAVKIGVVGGTKAGVRFVPKFVSKLKTFTGVPKYTFKPTTLILEKGTKIILTKQPTIATKAFSTVERVGRTQFWKGLSSYVKGELVFAKAYPIAKGYPKIGRGVDFYAKITKYKGFGKRVLELPKVVTQEQVGATLKHTYRGLGKGGLTRTTVYQRIYKPTGLFRKEIKQVYVSTTKGTTYQKIMADTGGGFIRPFLSEEARRIPVMRITQKGIFRSTDAAARLVPTVSVPHHISRMGTRGFGSLGREPLILSFTRTSITPSVATTGLRFISASQQGQLGLTELGEIQMNIQRGELSYKQGIDTEQIQKTIHSYAQVDMQVNKTIQKQQQKQMQSSKTITRQTYQPADKTVKRYIKTSRGTVTKPPVVIPFSLPDLEGKTKKRKKKKPVDVLFKGYRYREWDVPTMKQLIGINNKWM